MTTLGTTTNGSALTYTSLITYTGLMYAWEQSGEPVAYATAAGYCGA